MRFLDLLTIFVLLFFRHVLLGLTLRLSFEKLLFICENSFSLVAISNMRGPLLFLIDLFAMFFDQKLLRRTIMMPVIDKRRKLILFWEKFSHKFDFPLMKKLKIALIASDYIQKITKIQSIAYRKILRNPHQPTGL